MLPDESMIVFGRSVSGQHTRLRDVPVTSPPGRSVRGETWNRRKKTNEKKKDETIFSMKEKQKEAKKNAMDLCMQERKKKTQKGKKRTKERVTFGMETGRETIRQSDQRVQRKTNHLHFVAFLHSEEVEG